MEQIAFNRVSERVYDILCQHTAFAAPILVAQCKRMGTSTVDLHQEDLPELSCLLVQAMSIVSNPQKSCRLYRALWQLVPEP